MGEQPNPWDLLQPQDATHGYPQFLVAQTIPSSNPLTVGARRLIATVDLELYSRDRYLRQKPSVVTGSKKPVVASRLPTRLPFGPRLPNTVAAGCVITERVSPLLAESCIDGCPSKGPKLSRHRGAKRFRRYGLLGTISLLSLGYLLADERRPYHEGPPDH